MLQTIHTPALQTQVIQTRPVQVNRVSTPTIAEESLPFTLKIVRTQAELNQAVLIRQAAYDRHLPEFAKSLVKPEAADFEKGTVVLLAESKEDGSAVGTMRIQTNAYKPLCLEQSIRLATMAQRITDGGSDAFGCDQPSGWPLGDHSFVQSFLYVLPTNRCRMDGNCRPRAGGPHVPAHAV